MIDSLKLTVTTAADGTGSATSTRAVLGKLLSVEWIDGDFADGVDGTFTFVGADSGVSTTFLTLTNANDDGWYPVRGIMKDQAGATVTYDATNEVYAPVVLNGKITLTIAQGGNAKTGGAVIYWEC